MKYINLNKFSYLITRKSNKQSLQSKINGFRNIILFAFFILLTSFWSNVVATTYYSRASAAWNVNSTWSTVSFASATNTGTFPLAGDAVNIGGGFTVTISSNADCASLTFQGAAATTNTLSINSGITLNVSGAVTIPRTTAGNINTLAVGDGILNAGNIAFTTVSNNPSRQKISINNGTVTSTGDITVNNNRNGPTFEFTGAGTLNVGIGLMSSGPSGGSLITSPGCTVNYNGSPQTVRGFTYENLTLSGIGAKTTSGGETVNGILSMEGTATATNSVAYGPSATLQYKGSISQTVGPEFGATFSGTGGVIINNANGISLNAAKTISYRLNMTLGTLNMADFALTAGSLTGSGNLTNTTGGVTTRTLTIGGDNTSPAAYSGAISDGTNAGGVALTKIGTGTLTLSGSSSYTRATTINGGTISVNTLANAGTNSAIGTGTTVAAISIAASGTLQYTGTGHSTTRPIILTGSGTTIDASGSGTLTLSGGVTGNTNNLTLTGSGNGTQSGVIATTTGTLTKSGAGTWILSNANTLTGLTTITAGTLEYGINNALSSGNVNVNGGTLNIKTFSDIVGAVTLTSGTISGTTGVLSGTSYTVQNGTISAILGGASTLTKTTAGTVILSGANSYSGLTTISAGTLQAGTALNMVGGLNIILGAFFNPTTFTSIANTLKLNGTSQTADTYGSTSSTANIQNNTYFTAGTTGLLNVTTSGCTSGDWDGSTDSDWNTASNWCGGILPTSLTDVTISSSATNQPIISVAATCNNITINLGASLTFAGSSTLTVSGNWTNSGTFTPTTGTVLFTKAGAQIVGPETFYNLTLGGSGAKTTAGVTVNGMLSMEGTASVTTVPTYGASSSLQYAGSAAQTTSTEFPGTFTGTGGVIINNANGVTLGGTKTINNTLFMTLGTLNMANTNLTVGSLTGSGNLTHSSGGAGNRTLTIGSDNTSPAAYTGIISNGTATSTILTKNGTGTLTLSGLNTYTGLSTISSGTISINTIQNVSGGASSLGAPTSVANGTVTIGATGILQYTGSGNTSNRVLSISSGATVDASGSGTLTLTGGTTNANRNWTITGTGNAIESGVIQSGTGTFTKNGTGTWTISTATNISGALTINAGTLEYGANNIFSTGTLTLNGGTLDLKTFNETIGAVTLNSGSIAGTTGTLTSTSAYAVRSGTISASLAGAVALNKTTASTVILSGANNTYSGLTTISAGTLQAGANIDMAGGLAITAGTIFNPSTFTSTTTTLSVSGVAQNSGTYGSTSSSATYKNNTYFTAGTTGTLSCSSSGCVAGTWLGFFSTDWNTASNWCGSTLPTAATNVTISSTAPNQPTINGAATCNSITINVGATLTIAGSNTLTVSGNWINNSGNSANFTANNSTVLFTGAAQNFTAGNTMSVFNNLTLGGSGSKTVLATEVTVNGLLSMEGTATASSTFTWGANSSLQYAGSSAQTTSSNEFPTPFTGTGGVIINNSNGVTLNISKTVNYRLTMTAGTLDLADLILTVGSLSGSGNITNATGGITARTVTVGSDNTSTTYSGVISNGSNAGGESLTKTGNGTLTLTSANTYTGTTSVTGGTLEYGINNTLAGGAVTVNGGTLDIKTFTDNVGAVTLTSGTIAGTTGILTGSSYTVQSGVVSAKLAGAVALTKNSLGTVILSGANTYSGLTTISAGTLQAGTNLSMTGNVTISLGALFNPGTFSSTTNTLTINGVAQNAGSYGSTSSSATFQNNTYFTAGTTGILTSSASGCVAGTWLGFVSTDWHTAINWCGSILPTAPTNVVISSTAPNQPVIGAAASCGSITIGVGASLTITGSNTLSVSGGNWVNSGTFTANTSTVIFDRANVQTIGTGPFYNLTLGGTSAKTTTGVAVNGMLSMEGTATATAVPTYGAGASIQYKGSAVQTTGLEFPAAFSGSGGVIINNSNGVTLGSAKVINNTLSMTLGTLNMANTSLTIGSLTGSGNLTHSSGAAGNRTLTIGSDNTSPAVYTGNITNGTATSVLLTKVGTGTLTLSGSSNYTGATTISAGTISVNNFANSGTNSPIGTGSTTPAISISGTGTLQYTGTGHSTNRAIILTGSGATLDASGSGSLALSGGVTGNTNNLNLIGSSTAALSGAIATTTGTLTKSGTGTWILSGANTYSGLTTISNGTLQAGVALNLTGGLAITSGAFFNPGTFTSTANTLAINSVIQNVGSYGSTSSSATYQNNTYFTAGTTGILNVTNTSCTAGTWIGFVSSDWHTATNWCNNSIPTAATNVTISATAANQPTISASAVCNNITIGASASLTISGANTLTVSGDWSNSGTFTANTSTVLFTNAAQIVGVGPYYNLTLGGSGAKNTTGVAVNGILSLEGTATASAVISYGANATLQYKGSAAQTATNNEFPATFTGTGGVIINNTNGVSLNAAKTIDNRLTMTLGTLNIAGNDLTIGSITGSSNITSSTGGVASKTITIGSDNTSPAAYTGAISDGTMSGLALTKVGTGTLILGGANTYTALTTVSAGTLQAGAALTMTGDLAISTGAFFNPSTFTSSTNALTINAIAQNAGSYGSTASSATFKDNAHFTAGTTGILNVLTTACISGTWFGLSNTDWNTSSNWCASTLPTSSTDVSILSTAPNQPILSAGSFCNNLSIGAGASLSLNGKLLTVSGAFSGSGILIGSSTSSLTILGTGNAGSINMDPTSTASKSLANLTLNRTSSGAVDLSDTLNITNTLTLTNGSFTTNSKLKLYASATGTGRIASINTVNATLIGNIISEGYAPGGTTDWAYLGSPVTNATIADWTSPWPTSGFPTSGFTGATGSAGGSFISVYTFDEAYAGTSSAGYIPATNITNSLENGRGYMVYLGDNFGTTGSIKFKVSGTPAIGNVVMPVTFTDTADVADNGWNLVANPYPSPIDWDAPSWTKTNMENATYIYNADIASYATYIGGVGANGGTNIIPIHQGFLVKANANSPSLISTEDTKVASNQALLKTGSTTNDDAILKIEVSKAGSTFKDETVVRFNSTSSLNFDSNLEAVKLSSLNKSALNVTTIADNIEYSINALPSFDANTIIPIKLKVSGNGVYNLSFNQIEAVLSTYASTFSASKLILENLLDGSKTSIDKSMNYNFSITKGDSIVNLLLYVQDNNVITNIDKYSAFDLLAIKTINGEYFVDVNLGSSETISVQVLNSIGQEVGLVKQSQIKTGLIKVDTDNLSTGMYFIQVSSNNKTINKKVFIN